MSTMRKGRAGDATLPQNVLAADGCGDARSKLKSPSLQDHDHRRPGKSHRGNIKTSAPKPVTDNYDRLLAVLEANAASAREPELIRRLRDAIRAIRGPAVVDRVSRERDR
jgi:hypothetical protein